MKAIQWAPSGNPFEGIPGEVTLLLSDNGKSYGYGYGPGTTMIFGCAQGDVSVNPKQWVVRHDDDRITVEDTLPEGAEIFDAWAYLAKMKAGEGKS